MGSVMTIAPGKWSRKSFPCVLFSLIYHVSDVTLLFASRSPLLFAMTMKCIFSSGKAFGLLAQYCLLLKPAKKSDLTQAHFRL
jgi:hypothetical protein